VHFGFTDEQMAARAAARALLQKGCDLPALRRVWSDGHGDSLKGVWRDLAAMGVQGLLAPGHLGGSGQDWVTLALVLAETGRVALPLPVMETAAVGIPSILEAGDPSQIAGSLLDGSALLTVGMDGEIAPAATTADFFILEDRLYARAEVDLEAVQSVDRTRDLARVRPRDRGVTIAPGTFDRAAAGTAAILIGLGRELIAMTVEYVKQRRQFGVPVGSFQAVKHHLANALLQVSFAEPAVWAAAHAFDTGDPDLRRSVSLAKAMASDAATLAARVALQCHGAMGYTDDYQLHLWLKRVWCLAAAHGSAGWHRDRIGQELGLSR
jgi:alkylation response protein AidB-like acyl-CoA dehydrogenase